MPAGGQPTIAAPTKLARRTLAETLLAQLRQQILTGNLRPGTQLPTEKAIGELFGVGRTTVREALQGLLAAGLVERHGGRLVVIDESGLPSSDRDEAVKVAQLSVHEIFDTRKLIEVEGARLAALQHTNADQAKLRRLLRQMNPADLVNYHLRHQQFHLTIVQMSKNEVLARVFERSIDILFRQPSYWRLLNATGKGAQRPLAGGGREGHERIIAAIASGSAVASAQAMYEHLNHVEQVLIRRMESDPNSDGNALAAAFESA